MHPGPHQHQPDARPRGCCHGDGEHQPAGRTEQRSVCGHKRTERVVEGGNKYPTYVVYMTGHQRSDEDDEEEEGEVDEDEDETVKKSSEEIEGKDSDGEVELKRKAESVQVEQSSL